MAKILSRKDILGYAFILIMVTVAVILKNKEIILPEMAALAVGCIIYEHPGWVARPFHIFLLPSITAVGGFLINSLPVDLPIRLMLTIIVVLLTLFLFKSALAPAIATGLLPVITNATSLYFVFAILTFTFLLFIILLIKPKYSQQPIAKIPQKLSNSIFFTAFILAWILACSINKWMFIAAIPPVWVVAYESVHKENYSIKVFCKQVICLSFAACIGIVSLYLFNNLLLAATLDLIAVTILLRLMKFNLTPAYPMAILPMVLQNASHRYFYLQVLVMSVLVLGIIYTAKKVILKVSVGASYQ